MRPGEPKPLSLLGRVLLALFLIAGVAVPTLVASWFFEAGWQAADPRVTPLLYMAGVAMLIPIGMVIFTWNLERKW